MSGATKRLDGKQADKYGGRPVSRRGARGRAGSSALRGRRQGARLRTMARAAGAG